MYHRQNPSRNSINSDFKQLSTADAIQEIPGYYF